MQLNKSFLLLFVGSNVIAALIAFIINTWVNISCEVDFISKYTYNLALSSFVFTLIDFGRINDSLLRKNDSKNDLIINIFFSISICILCLAFKLISLPVFGVGVILFIQRYSLNYNVIRESGRGTWLLQISGPMIRLLLVVLISMNIEMNDISILILGLIMVLIMLLKYGAIKLFTRTAFNIGLLNLGLILIERFDVLTLRSSLSNVDYASLSAILSYTYLVGIFADPIIKLLYKSGNELSIEFLDKKIRENVRYIMILTSAIIIIGYVVLEYSFGNKFTNILLFLFYGVLLQVIRLISQIYEITILEKSIYTIIAIRAISILILIIGVFVLKYLGILIALTIFLLARLTPVFAIRRL